MTQREGSALGRATDGHGRGGVGDLQIGAALEEVGERDFLLLDQTEERELAEDFARLILVEMKLGADFAHGPVAIDREEHAPLERAQFDVVRVVLEVRADLEDITRLRERAGAGQHEGLTGRFWIHARSRATIRRASCWFQRTGVR